jgi:hypothetical protein
MSIKSGEALDKEVKHMEVPSFSKFISIFQVKKSSHQLKVIIKERS